jgi:hypothetical protein
MPLTIRNFKNAHNFFTPHSKAYQIRPIPGCNLQLQFLFSSSALEVKSNDDNNIDDNAQYARDEKLPKSPSGDDEDNDLTTAPAKKARMDKTPSIQDTVNVSTGSRVSVLSMDTTSVKVILPADEKDSSKEEQVIRRSTRRRTNRFAFV